MPVSVGIIGAGLAGLTLATRLTEAGHSTVCFDKGRGVGGRTSTRRTESTAFDHGAQYFTVRDPRFAAFLETHLPADRWAPWEGRFGSLVDGRVVAETRQETRYVGVPGMSAIARALASTLDVRTDARIVEIAGGPGAWALIDAKGSQAGPFDWVVSTAPPVQSAELFRGRTSLSDVIQAVKMTPCFAWLIEPSSAQAFPFDGIRAEDEVIGWLANDHSKPGRGPSSALVIQSNNDWAEAHVDDPPIEILARLREAVVGLFEIDLESPNFETLHRWLYAKPVQPLGREFVLDPTARLAACGDWCVAGKVEGAFLSGLALAEELIGHG